MKAFNIFRKKKHNDKSTPPKVRLNDLKCRKICYIDSDFKELTEAMSKSPEVILTLKPVNYYAVKNQYIMAHIYTSADYSENYIKLQRFDHEHRTDESELFSIDSESVIKALAKSRHYCLKY